MGTQLDKIGRRAGLPLALLAAGWALGAHAEDAKPSAIFSGLPSELARKADWFGNESDVPCVVFTVRLRKAVKAPRLTTNGLGASRLAAAPTGACPDPRTGWSPDIALENVGGGQTVALRIAGDVARGDVKHAGGHVIAYGDDGELGAADLTVNQQPAISLWPSFEWFLGLFVPVAVAYGATRFTDWRSAVRKENEALVVFRTVDKATVDQVTADVVTVLGDLKRYTHPGAQVLESLQTHVVIDKLPSRSRERLIRNCEADRMDRVVSDLMQLFPMHAETLRDPASRAGLRMRGLACL